jgi:hypothetical protein
MAADVNAVLLWLSAARTAGGSRTVDAPCKWAQPLPQRRAGGAPMASRLAVRFNDQPDPPPAF